MNKIIEHITSVYGFELVTPSIPRNEFQYFKRAVYLFIKDKISEKLFYLLRDKVSSIKFLSVRPDGEIWFRKRFSVERGALCEIEIRPIPPEAAIYLSNKKGYYTPDYGNNYKVSIWYPTNYRESGGESLEFPINLKSGQESIDANFSDLPLLKEALRDYKLKQLLND